MRHFTIPLICSALLVFPAPLLAQDPDQSRQLQLAQSLEQAGEWTRASVLYEGLYRADSLNYVYFDALRRAYIQLKEYRKAIYLVQRRIVLRPGEAFLTAQLGGLTYDEGEPVRADSLWNVALLLQPANRQMYVIVAQQMQERRLYDKAIRTYEAGRGATRNPVDFVEELALLHSATQAYGSAVEGVTERKAARLRRLAARWLAEHPLRPDEVRIDVVGVLVTPGGPPRVDHVRGIG